MTAPTANSLPHMSMMVVTGIITSWSAKAEPNIATRLRAATLGKPVEPGQGAQRLLLGLQLLFMMLGHFV